MIVGGVRRLLIFLDVDGVLLPFRARPTPPARSLRSRDDTANPLLDRLDPDDGRRLRVLECPIVWATTWGEEANEVIAPMLGLPPLPVVPWPDTDPEPEAGLHWKTPLLTLWSAQRPFIWFDDEITEADRQWVAAHHPVPALLHRVDPYVGLTARTFDAVRRWLRESPLA